MVYIDVAGCYCIVYIDVAGCYCMVCIDVAVCYYVVYIDVVVCYCIVYIDYDVPGWFFGRKSKWNIREKNPAELINKSTPKKKLNRYTELFRNFSGNEITLVDSSLISIINRTVRHTTFALHSLFVSLTTLVKDHCCSVLPF
jgi:hypothetical protein